MKLRRIPGLHAACLAMAFVAVIAAQGPPNDALLARVRDYIKNSWTTLTRSNQDLPQALPDPKMPRQPGQPWLLYIAPGESQPRVAGEVRRVFGDEWKKQVAIRIAATGRALDPRARAAVPATPIRRARRPIQRNVRLGQLLHRTRPVARRRTERARDMVDNFVYEITRLRHHPQRQSHATSSPDRSRPF